MKSHSSHAPKIVTEIFAKNYGKKYDKKFGILYAFITWPPRMRLLFAEIFFKRSGTLDTRNERVLKHIVGFIIPLYVACFFDEIHSTNLV